MHYLLLYGTLYMDDNAIHCFNGQKCDSKEDLIQMIRYSYDTPLDIEEIHERKHTGHYLIQGDVNGTPAEADIKTGEVKGKDLL